MSAVLAVTVEPTHTETPLSLLEQRSSTMFATIITLALLTQAPAPATQTPFQALVRGAGCEEA